MNITIDREVLLENLNIISRGLPSKSPMPILTGIKFYVTENDLFMTSSNTDISVEVTITDSSLQITEAGSTVVPGRLFIDIIRKINSKKVNLFLSDDKILIVKADRGEYKLHIMDPLNYPKIDFVPLENPLTLHSDVLKSLIKETVFATAQTEKKPILAGVNFVNNNNELIVTATDSFRLSQKITNIREYKDFNITIPNKSLDEMLKALDVYDGDVNLYFTQNRLLAQYRNVCFQTRLLDGTYPDTSKLIPDSFETILSVNLNDYFNAIDRASLLTNESDKNTIVLESNKNEAIISSNIPEIGNVKENIKINNSKSEEIKIAFSSKYMMDAIKTFNSDEIELCFNGDIKPIIIRSKEDNSLIQLIVPIRTY